MGVIKVLLQIALRNLFARRSNLVIGCIMLAGSLLIVVGGSILDSLDVSLGRSIISSGTGEVQIYAAASKDPLDLNEEPRLSTIADFPRVKKVLESIPNVQQVIPMGLHTTEVLSGNPMDLTIEKLRDEIRARRSGAGPVDHAREDSLKELVRQMCRLLQESMAKAGESFSAVYARENEAVLAKAISEQFWADFDKDPLTSLEFLENSVVPMMVDAEPISLRMVGTDLDSFRKSFERMRLVDGQWVPEGHRGLLLGKLFYEDSFKLKNARRLDVIKDAMEHKGQTIAADPALRELVAQNKAQVHEILFQLDRITTGVLVARLQKMLGSTEPSPVTLLVAFFDTDDANFMDRYKLFYAQVAPLLDLYRTRVGDTLTIKADTRAGYVRAINVKFYGTIEFLGMERSPLAGTMNLIDLISMRELYGEATPEMLAEISRLKEASGVKEVDRAGAEDALFSSSASTVSEGTEAAIEEGNSLGSAALRAKLEEEQLHRAYSREELERAGVLYGAVLLKDSDQMAGTMAAVEQVSEREHLGLKVTSWSQASGLIGQFVLVAKVGLYFAAFIIFLAAMVIITNAMLMATLQRTSELGTMRALGAQRTFIGSLIVTETVVMGTFFGGLGILLGGGFTLYLRKVGIPAVTDELSFFFSGPRLFPVISAGTLLVALFVVLAVSICATLYPAYLATSVQPVQAMRSDE